MNTKRIQFNQRWRVALLLVTLILALAASLVWIRIETTAFFQTVKMTQACAYSPQPGQMETAAEGGCPKADLGQDENWSRPWSLLKFS